MEMMVVVAMILILAGALVSSMSGARERAKITVATVAVNEITKAILMFENYSPTRDLSGHECEEQEATESSLAFILGGGDTDLGGNRIPVLYNASIKDGKLLDPWNRPYLVTIRAGTANIAQTDRMQNTKKTGIALPNFWRRSAGEAD